jgi:hypothetical protein
MPPHPIQTALAERARTAATIPAETASASFSIAEKTTSLFQKSRYLDIKILDAKIHGWRL